MGKRHCIDQEFYYHKEEESLASFTCLGKTTSHAAFAEVVLSAAHEQEFLQGYPKSSMGSEKQSDPRGEGGLGKRRLLAVAARTAADAIVFSVSLLKESRLHLCCVTICLVD